MGTYKSRNIYMDVSSTSVATRGSTMPKVASLETFHYLNRSNRSQYYLTICVGIYSCLYLIISFIADEVMQVGDMYKTINILYYIFYIFYQVPPMKAML